MTKKKPLAEPLPEPTGGYKAREGMRVQVLSANKKRNMGLGTITIVSELIYLHEDGREELLSKHYPFQIVLDNGRATEGCKCWWYPIKESQSEQKDDTDG